MKKIYNFQGWAISSRNVRELYSPITVLFIKWLHELENTKYVIIYII